MPEIDVFRHSHLVDPQLHIWGWEIPVYLFLGGLTAGLLITTGLLTHRFPRNARSPWVRRMPLVAMAALSVGMLALLLDLEHPGHVLRFYAAFMPMSPMSWGAWILVAIYPLAALMAFAALDDDVVDRLADRAAAAATVRSIYRWARRAEHTLASLAIVLGIALGAYTGVLLGTLAARAAWNSMVLAPLFLVSGFSTGAAAMMLAPLHADERRLIQRWDLWAIAAELALLSLFFLGLMSGGGTPGYHAAMLFFGGPFTAPFFALVVLAGLFAPLALELTELRKHLAPTIAAPALILIGGLALRWILVAAGQA
jgi:formate-dependent nitrite reductase membrane component NrfD